MKRTLLTLILLSLITSLSAAVVFTDIPDTRVSAGGLDKIDIDFDLDGIREFVIKLDNGGIIIKTNYIFVDGGGSNVNAFNTGDTISSSHGFVNGGNLNIQKASSGNFTFGEDLYIGVSMRDFPNSGDNTFGWIRIRVDGNEDCTVYDMAYETVHNKPIAAGHKGGGFYVGINKTEKPVFSIYPNPTSDRIYLDFGSKQNDIENIHLYSIRGELLNSFVSSEKEINLSDYNQGQYLLSIQFKNKAIETRRIIVE